MTDDQHHPKREAGRSQIPNYFCVTIRDCLVSHSGLRTGLFGPATPAFSARSWATNLKSRPPLDPKSLVLACGLTYQTVS